MLNLFYLFMAFVAFAITVFYTWFYEVSIPGGQYHYTYAGVAFTAALIFAGLWLAGRINRDEARSRVLIE